MTILQQALLNIISDWEFQAESCDILFPTTTEYALAYSKLTGLRQALDQLRFAGLVTYDNGKWNIAD
jgi:hypothetical protein